MTTTRRAPYGFTLNDYPLRFERHGSLRAYRRDFPRIAGMAGLRNGYRVLVLAVASNSWIVARYVRHMTGGTL